MFEGVLAEDEEVVIFPSQTVGTHLQLVGALLTADVENLLLWHAEHGLQRESRFTYARLTAKKYDGTRHETTAQNTVQLLVMHVDAGIIVIGDFTESKHFVLSQCMTRCSCRIRGRLLFGVGCHTDLLKGVPLPARRAFTNPLRRLLAAVGTNICDLVFCHIVCKDNEKPPPVQIFMYDCFFSDSIFLSADVQLVDYQTVRLKGDSNVFTGMNRGVTALPKEPFFINFTIDKQTADNCN